MISSPLIHAVYTANSQPYLEYQFSKDEEPIRLRESDLIKHKIEFKNFLNTLINQFDSSKSQEYINKFCASDILMTCHVEFEPQPNSKNWIIQVEAFYDSFNFDTYGIVYRDGEILIINKKDLE